MRLNKFISLSGIASRREADNLIKSAIVTVNDLVETNPAYQVSISDKVKCDEKIISHKEIKENQDKLSLILGTLYKIFISYHASVPRLLRGGSSYCPGCSG